MRQSNVYSNKNMRALKSHLVVHLTVFLVYHILKIHTSYFLFPYMDGANDTPGKAISSLVQQDFCNFSCQVMWERDSGNLGSQNMLERTSNNNSSITFFISLKN